MTHSITTMVPSCPGPTSHTSAAKSAAALHRAGAQPALFGSRLDRSSLLALNLPTECIAEHTVNVWRNHAVETIVEIAAPWFAFGRLKVNCHLSDYDDAMIFVGHHSAAAELLWFDPSRHGKQMSSAQLCEWMQARVRHLRTLTHAPILLATWGRTLDELDALRAAVEAISGVTLQDLSKPCIDAGVGLIDLRTAELSGTPISKSAQLILARELACRWIPSIVQPPLKAVVFDLDNTLHAGVLGEDGVSGVSLTAAHLELHGVARQLRDRGVFLGLLSRNERADVEALLAQRRDYGLRLADFSATEISWRDKASGLVSIADRLRIGLDSIVFVDDNPGELASVAEALPAVNLVHAHPDPAITRRTLEYFPGLWRSRVGADDGRRLADLAANSERATLLASSSDVAGYLRSLNVSLRIRHNPSDQLERLVDLCRKTNQFNLALRRLSHAEVADRMSRADACVASVELTDRLTESGVIAVIVAERTGHALTVTELCVSCRALGRHLEDTIVLETLRRMPLSRDVDTIAFQVSRGPRNQPAIDWLSSVTGTAWDGASIVPISADRVRAFAVIDGVSICES